MTTLQEAWIWDQETRRVLRVAKRLGDLHWDRLPWDGELGKDEELKPFQGAQVAGQADRALAQLDDLAIVLFFSVFESTVRERIRAEVGVEKLTLQHPVLRCAADEAEQSLDRGSFHRVLELLKKYDPNLVEQVRQVRRYRNWVSHGRRGQRPSPFNARSAYARLNAFLERLERESPRGEA
ncbi:MAG: hypothetical protein ACYC61_22595 [Isosphaeraceae bacterium]